MMDAPNLFSTFPSYPKFPSISGPNIVGDMPTMPLGVNGVKANNSVLGTFNTLLTEASKEIQKPQQLSEQMMKGEREFNAADLMVSMLEAEKKLNVTVRVINDIVKGIKQLEQIQV